MGEGNSILIKKGREKGVKGRGEEIELGERMKGRRETKGSGRRRAYKEIRDEKWINSDTGERNKKEHEVILVMKKKAQCNFLFPICFC